MKMSPYCNGPPISIFLIPRPLRQTHLCAGMIEEGVGVHAIADGAAHEGDPVEDHGGLVGLLEEQLTEHIDHNGQRNE